LRGLVERSIAAHRLATEFDNIVAARGVASRAVQLDKRPEMIATALAHGPAPATGRLFIPPDAPWRKPFIESSNGRLLDEWLSINLLWSLADACFVTDNRKHEYSRARNIHCGSPSQDRRFCGDAGDRSTADSEKFRDPKGIRSG
jgi:hypothetical protein